MVCKCSTPRVLAVVVCCKNWCRKAEQLRFRPWEISWIHQDLLPTLRLKNIRVGALRALCALHGLRAMFFSCHVPCFASTRSELWSLWVLTPLVRLSFASLGFRDNYDAWIMQKLQHVCAECCNLFQVSVVSLSPEIFALKNLCVCSPNQALRFPVVLAVAAQHSWREHATILRQLPEGLENILNVLMRQNQVTMTLEKDICRVSIVSLTVQNNRDNFSFIGRLLHFELNMLAISWDYSRKPCLCPQTGLNQ